MERRHPPQLPFAALLLAAAAPAQWAYVPTNPPPGRTDAAMTFDLITGKVLMFGGTGGPANDTWTYDGVQWVQQFPATSPPLARRNHLIYDLARNVAVLYGGLTGNPQAGQCSDDHWEWNGTNWTLLQPTSTPGGLGYYAGAYDLVRQRIVIHGGRRNAWIPAAVNETWEFDPVQNRWLQISTTNSPGAIEEAAMCFHLGMGQSLLFGGIDPQTNAVVNDLWSYDGATWTLLQPTGPRPGPRIAARMVYDNLRQVAVVFGGRDPVTWAIHNDTWEFDGTQWRRVDSGLAPARIDFSMAMDFWRGRMVIFGGRLANNSVQDDTWEYGASHSTFGNGCPGAGGAPTLRALTPPKLGAVCDVRLGNLPAGSGAALMVTGVTNRTWAFGNLPALLTSFGMPNCRVYTSSDLFQVLPVTAGTATWSWQVPVNPVLVGTHLYQQGIGLEPGWNAAGMIVSNAGDGVIGF